MQIALFGAAIPELRLRPAPVLIGVGAAMLSPLSWLLTGASLHVPAGPIYAAGATLLAGGLALEGLRRRSRQ